MLARYTVPSDSRFTPLHCILDFFNERRRIAPVGTLQVTACCGGRR